MAERIINAYLVKKDDYGIFDEIITILCTNGNKYVCLSKGSKKINSKNARNLFIGSFIEFVIFEARSENKISRLKKANCITAAPWNIEGNNALNILNQCIVKATTTSKEFFNFYKYGVELITKKPENEYVNICAILKNYILLFGLMSEPNYCISCGNQEINNFSPYLGGMVCQTCTQKKDIPKIDPNVFQIIFGIFNDDKFLDNPTVEKNILRSVITILLQYVQKNLDTKILFK